MFGRKTHGDVKKSATKVLDPKKDTVTRLKHLRVVLETYDVDDARNFFDQHYSYIYYIFHDHFTTVEADLKQRANKQHREELDFVLYVLEKILTLLPELIHKRWQYHSIGRIMKKLLHPGNSIKVQREGMRLFLIWYQILMDNATEECHATYRCLVPQLGSAEGIATDIFTARPVGNPKVLPMEISPILPPLSGEDHHENLTKMLLKFLLKYMVEEVKKIHWSSPEMHIFTFNFLFNKFKEFYLKNIFPEFKDTSIYTPCTDLPEKRLWHPATEANRPPTLALCQEAVVEWFTRMLTIKKTKPALEPPDPQDKPPEETVNRTDSLEIHGDAQPGSNASTLSMGSSNTEPDSTGSEAQDEQTAAEHEIVRNVIYSCKENIDILHEVFRQAFQFPFQEGSTEAMRRVIHIYTEWFKIVDEKERPVFMRESLGPGEISPCVTVPRSESTPVIQNGGEIDHSYSKSHPHLPDVVAMGNHVINNGSDPGQSQNICAGLQRVLQVFIVNAANVFLLDLVPVPGRESEHGVQLTAQVAICKKVINSYRFVIQHHFMEQKTWEQMLLVLLRITSGVLNQTPPPHRETTLGGKLAHPLLQTLIVTWIKANIHVHVSVELWDHFYKVLSSLTRWAELVQEWAKHMETLTRVLARHVYELDLNDLPLDRLSELKAKRRRAGRSQAKDDRKRTFTRGLSRNDPVDILKAQMRNRGDLDPSRVAIHPLSISESAPVVHNSQSGMFRDDSDRRLTRHRSRSGEASPLSVSQTHLLSDGLPMPGAMMRSSSDSSLMVDLEKTGSSDILAEESLYPGDRRSLTEEVLTHIGTYYSASEDIEESDPDDEIFHKILTDLEDKEASNPIKEIQAVRKVEPIVKKTNLANEQSPQKGIMGQKSPERASTSSNTRSSIIDSLSDPASAAPKFYLPSVSVEGATDDDTEVESIGKSSVKSHDVITPTNENTSSHLKPSGTSGSSHETDGGSVSSSAVADNMSIASGDSSVPYHIIDTTDSNSISFDRASIRSDTDPLLRLTEGSSRTSLLETNTSTPATQQNHKGGNDKTRPDLDTSSLSNHNHTDQAMGDESLGNLGDNEEEDSVDNVGMRPGRRIKDSPTPDRESIHIEDITPVHQKTSDRLAVPEEDQRSVVVGGSLPGWTPVSAVILWHRMLGCFGDINKISDPEIHAQVYEYLCDLMDLMLKMRRNQGVTADNLSTPLPPQFFPPVLLLSGWLYEALCLPKEYKRGTVLAYRLLCTGLVRRHDENIPDEQLARFYRILHHGLVSQDQDVINVLVRHCGSKLFSMPLCGATMLLLDFVQAADTITAATDLREAPRAEAVSLLGSLVCYPAHLQKVPVLQPNCKELSILQCTDLKDHVINILLRAGKKEPAGLARCIAISSLGIYIYQELCYQTLHPKLKEAFHVLLATLRVSDTQVAQVATDTLTLLCDHIPTLLTLLPSLPRKVIQEIANAIYILLLSLDNSSPEKSKRLLVSTMFCLLEWCMRVPVSVLLETTQGNSCLLHLVFKVLHIVLCGPQGVSSQQHRNLRNEMTLTDEDIPDNVPTRPGVSKSVLDFLPDYSSRGQRGLPPSHNDIGDEDGENSGLRLAAKTVMSHLVNHLGHFPIGNDAGQLNTTVQEHHDLEDLYLDELTSDIFNSPNVQFFVLNNTILLTLVEIPALTNLPGGGVTAGLTTAASVTRAVIRDTTGKFCWDSSVLYGPPLCRAGSYPAEPTVMLEPIEDLDHVGQPSSSESVPDNVSLRAEDSLCLDDLPSFEAEIAGQDNLDQMLLYIGYSSPECQLHSGEALNVPFHRPEEVSLSTEDGIRESVLVQRQEESQYFSQHQSDSSMSAQPLAPMEDIDFTSPFHLCRLFLNQLGFLQWEKRLHFDLLRKTDKLLRELKHLDSQRCRETHKIAVIYVAQGQEDKQSILSNSVGSKAYEDFVAGLGWEVELEMHTGFMGGLQSNRSTGVTAPYYATSTQEVIYHVATRMPSEEDEDKHRKLRHLGNDEVQIVWSEHRRDYRRGIIPTEFGDVLIIIYPLENGLYRIQINRKPEVPYIGPLFDGAIVDSRVLPGLVRATALNAGRILRLQKPYYQSFYEERARYVEDIACHHKEATMFEDFTAQVFAPVQSQDSLPGPYQPTPVHGVSNHSQKEHLNKSDPMGSQVSLSEPLSIQTSQFYSNLGSDTDSLHSRGSHDKVSPHTGKVKGEGSAFQRRLSFGKSKKSVTKQMQLQQQIGTQSPLMVAPPDSPNSTKIRK